MRFPVPTRFCSTALRASARSATLFSTAMLQMAGNTVCSKSKHFNRPLWISLFSLFFERLPSPDTNAVTDSFYGIELGLPLLLLCSSRLDWLAPYCSFTFLARTHNYLAGIHNDFFIFQTLKTTVHRGLPLGGWYCAISFFFLGFANTAGPFLFGCAPPGLSLGEPGHPRADSAGTFSSGRCLFDFCFVFFVQMNVP